MPVDADDLQRRARSFARDLVALHGFDLEQKVAALARLGQTEIAEATACMERPARTLASPDDAVGAQLDRLKTIVADLDPGRIPPLTWSQRLFGPGKGGAAAPGYFDRYERAQDAIADVLRRLAAGRDDLAQANIAIATRQAQLDRALDRLDRIVKLAELLDTLIDAAAREIQATDPAKAQLLRLAALGAVRQRAQDLVTHLTIATQARLALDIVVQNNLKLMDGVDHATTATVAALRVAITAADAIAHQRLILDRIARVDEVAVRLEADPAAQHLALQTAFTDVYQSIEALDDFRTRRLDRPTR